MSRNYVVFYILPTVVNLFFGKNAQINYSKAVLTFSELSVTLVENKSCTKCYKMTGDNKRRGFCYKAFDRILVPNKELKQFKIRNRDLCSQSKNPDSLEHTF